MKQGHLLVAFLFLMSLASCRKDTLSHGADYTRSYKAWQAFKASSNNAYRYLVATTSWTGYGTETVITVKNGKVVGRSYVAKLHANNGTGAVTVTAQWTEDETQLSTHQEGAPALTLDAIYEQARTHWLLKRDDAKTYFEAKNNGMISSCGYVPNGCADDCFMGIHISLIEAI